MSVDAWLDDLTAVALIGTARRAAPASPAGVPERRSAPPPEVALLDALALSSTLRRAGRGPAAADPETSPAASDDRRPPAPARARQILDLLLTQPPVGARLAPYAIGAWLRAADRGGFRVHHPALVPLLERATTHPELRGAVLPVLDVRGTWLAAQHRPWRWAGGPEVEQVVTAEAWAHLPTTERAVHLRRLRARDPGAGRDLLDSTWRTDPAPARAELLGAMEIGLSDADEPLLERALDDRARDVRETAYRLLDGLPGSARARRLGAVLAPLLSSTGMLRKSIQVELPGSPTPEAVRDGLTAGPRGRSERAFWLSRLAAAAPFETWTATGLDPATVVRTLAEPEALAGLRAAALARRDATWARALLERVWDPGLARCLPPDEAGRRMLRRVQEVRTLADLTSAVRLLPGPWTEVTSMAVLARLERLERPPHLLPDLVAQLAEALHPRTAPTVQRLAGAGPTDPIHQLAQLLTLVPTITEAFA